MLQACDPRLTPLQVAGVDIDMTGVGSAEILSDPVAVGFGRPNDIGVNARGIQLSGFLVGPDVGGANDVTVNLYRVPEGNADKRETTPFATKTLDLSDGAAQGGELVTNGDFALATGWTQGAGWSIAAGVAAHDDAGGLGELSRSVTTVGSGYHLLLLDVTALAAGGNVQAFLDDQFLETYAATGTKQALAFKPDAAAAQPIRLLAGLDATLDNVSLKSSPLYNFVDVRLTLDDDLGVGDAIAYGFVPAVDFSGDTFLSASVRRFR